LAKVNALCAVQAYSHTRHGFTHVMYRSITKRIANYQSSWTVALSIVTATLRSIA